MWLIFFLLYLSVSVVSGVEDLSPDDDFNSSTSLTPAATDNNKTLSTPGLDRYEYKKQLLLNIQHVIIAHHKLLPRHW